MSKVYLLGTGPGDEELMTLKAVRVLGKCTAVLYDRLAGGNILKYVKEGCRVYYCGKEPGCHYKTQDEINDMLVALAKEGHTVGRIKGGDPYVFGRGGEEALRLLEEGIEFEVVPGITSAVSVPGYAGIPVTHRGLSQSFHVFTGKSAGSLNINFEAAAKLDGTLIFLMGLESLEAIVSGLSSAGMDADTPCAVIMRGTTARQRKAVGSLKDIADKVRKAGFKSPCIIVVGKVVALSSSLSWFEKKPLFGWNICVTRSKEQTREISEKLVELGAEVTEINSIRFKNTAHKLESCVEGLSVYDYIAFTSVNSVNIFFDYLREKGIDIRNLKGKLCVIGPATERSLRERGLIPDICAAEFVSEDLCSRMKAVVKEGDRVLIPCSRDSRDALRWGLEESGCRVDEVHTYEVEAGEVKNTAAFEETDVVLFTSPSTVKNMIKLLGAGEIKKKVCLSIGPITGRELERNGIEAIVCDEYSTDGIIKKLVELRQRTYC